MLELLEEFKEYLITGLISLITGIIAYFTGKRMTEAETKKAEGSALETIQAVYDKFTADTKAKVDELSEEITRLTLKVKGLSLDVNTLEKDLEDCRQNLIEPIKPILNETPVRKSISKKTK